MIRPLSRIRRRMPPPLVMVEPEPEPEFVPGRQKAVEGRWVDDPTSTFDADRVVDREATPR